MTKPKANWYKNILTFNRPFKAYNCNQDVTEKLEETDLIEERAKKAKIDQNHSLEIWDSRKLT